MIDPEQHLQVFSAEERQALLVTLLKDLQPGRQPLPVFTELARISPLATIEVAAVRHNPETTQPEIFLTQRPEDDPWWPKEWHIPGVVLLGSDTADHRQDFSSPFTRIKSEARSSIQTDRLRLLGVEHRDTPRGKELTTIFWTEAKVHDDFTPSADGTFFSAEDLANPPEAGLVIGHLELAEKALAAYTQSLGLREF